MLTQNQVNSITKAQTEFLDFAFSFLPSTKLSTTIVGPKQCTTWYLTELWLKGYTPWKK
jgi:hypothetical protein